MEENAKPRQLIRRIGAILRQLGAIRLVLTFALLAGAVYLARYSWDLPLSRDAERFLFDVRESVAAPMVEQDQRIVLVTYTDETLAATGKRSPLDRAILARALKRIDSFKPKAIGIDILIDQPQPEDRMAIEAFRTVKTPTWLAHASASVATMKIQHWQQQFLEGFVGQLQPGNVRAASIVIEADSDNVLRSWPMAHLDGKQRLPVAMTAEKGADFTSYTGSVRFRRSNTEEAPLFNSIPIDIFANDAFFANPEAEALYRAQIEDKYVLIGGQIQDIDVFETPVYRTSGAMTWGIEIFAHMIAQILDGKLLKPISERALWIAATGVVLAGALTALGSVRLAITAMLVIVQLAAFVLFPSFLQARDVDTQHLPAFGQALGWLIGFVAAGSAARALGSEQRKFAQSALGKYLPRDIATEIMRNPESLALHGEKREIFVVFTDLEGFTQLSHAIDPDTVAQLLNRYLDMLSEVVLEHGGTLDKFVGDAIVAFWGAPISRPDDGERAAQAAIALNAAGERFRKEVKEGTPTIGVTRVGLHFGEAVVGNFGGEGRIQYTALGDSMNTASRLESANKKTQTGVLFSREAMERSGMSNCRYLGKVLLRGRATPIDIFEPQPGATMEQVAAFNAIAERAVAGDVSAITEVSEFSSNCPHDRALAGFVDRLARQERGGYFVLD